MPSANRFYSAVDLPAGVNHFRYATAFQTPEHKHDEYAIIGLIDGWAEYTQFHQVERIGRGEFLITNGAIPHSSRYRIGHQPSEGVALTLSSQYFHHLLERAGVRPDQQGRQCALMGKISAPSAIPLMDNLVAALKSDCGHSVHVNMLVDSLASSVIAAWPRPLISEQRVSHCSPSMSRQQFIGALEFMNECTRSGFSIDLLCSVLGVSQRQLYRIFHGSTGLTPGRYFTEVLINRAEEMLVFKGAHVKAVAYELGFCDARELSATYRRVRGKAPSHHLKPAW
jgi:AraC-like DNA-binding protein